MAIPVVVDYEKRGSPLMNSSMIPMESFAVASYDDYVALVQCRIIKTDTLSRANVSWENPKLEADSLGLFQIVSMAASTNARGRCIRLSTTNLHQGCKPAASPK